MLWSGDTCLLVIETQSSETQQTKQQAASVQIKHTHLNMLIPSIFFYFGVLHVWLLKRGAVVVHVSISSLKDMCVSH